jgi:hypothetical protein
MNKESVIAIVLGLVFGILVAGGFLLFTNKSQTVTSKQTTQIASSSAKLEPTQVFPTITVMSSLTIQNPTSGSVTEEKMIRVTGTTSKRALVVLQTPIQTLSKKIDDEVFSFEVSLAYGENSLSLFAYPEGTSIPIQKSLYIYRLPPL